MKQIKYVAIDNTGRIVLEEDTFEIIYKIVNSFNRSHGKKLRIAKKIITVEIEEMRKS